MPYISKIFEKCIYDRLLYFFINRDVISAQQFGFLPNKSTLDALNSFMEFQYDALNSKQYSINVFIDLTKAFDTIDHKILLGKLEKYGVRGLPLKLIQTYISDRMYRVNLGAETSSLNTSNIGTAQGSILAPLFFIIYVNDLPNFLDQSYPILYADDTTLCFRNSSFQSAIDQCNRELYKLSQWCSMNKLTINLNKTCYMVITNRSICNVNPIIKIKNNLIKCVQSHKFLGIKIDNRLKFDQHIADISVKISKSIGILFKLSNVLPSSTLLSIYNSLVHSHLMYCNAIWGGTHDVHIHPLFMLQKKCIRIINKTSFLAHTHPLFASNNILKIKDIHRYSQTCFIYKNLNIFSSLVQTHPYSLRNNYLRPKFQRLAICQRSIYFSGIKYWNLLSDNIQCIDDERKFRKSLKLIILESYNS